MKKLGKLKLNPEKMLNHDELVSFKGGSSGDPIDYCCGLFVNVSCNGVGMQYFAEHCSGYGCLELFQCGEAHCGCNLSTCDTSWCGYA